MPNFSNFDLNLQLETLLGIGATIIRVLLILLAGYIFTRVVRRWMPKLNERLTTHLLREEGTRRVEMEKRVKTLSALTGTTIASVIWVMIALIAVRELGFDIAPILAGAGVIGLAVGFGAQNLVKDVISGAFMLVENQIRVGDVAVLNDQGGLVEEINLRTTVLRSLDGGVHVFPNGNINKIANMTRDFSCYVFDIGIAYKEDVDHVIEVLRKISDEMMEDETFAPLMLEPLDIFGLDKMADSAIVIKGRVKTLPLKQWQVGREFNRRIKKRFDELGIEIPFPQRSLHVATGWEKLSKPSREELKDLVKQVIGELREEEPALAGGPSRRSGNGRS